ncbi:MAG: site-2 protease family protein [Planctomycetota bacterium]
MFGKSIKLFKLFGFEVKIDVSWLIILVLVVWSLSGGVFPEMYEGLATATYWLMGAAAALGLFMSIVLHELCHSLAARRFGLPMTGITLFMFGGVAEMSDEPPSPKAELVMAVAGPACSVVIAAVCLTLAHFGKRFGWPVVPTGVVRWIGLINVILVCFNLIPGFPLDGGRVLRAILWHYKRNLRKATRIASRVGMTFGGVLIALGVLQLLLAFTESGVRTSPIGGLWWILIGMFIRGAASQGYRQVLIREALHGEPVRRFMNDHPVTVPSDLSLHDLVEDYVYKHHFKMFPVVDDGHLAGCVTTRQVKSVPRGEWPEKTVDDIAESCTDENTVGPESDTMDALNKMNKGKISRLMVVEGDRLDGILTLKDLLKFLSLKLELEGEEEEGERLDDRLSAAEES